MHNAWYRHYISISVALQLSAVQLTAAQAGRASISSPAAKAFGVASPAATSPLLLCISTSPGEQRAVLEGGDSEGVPGRTRASLGHCPVGCYPGTPSSPLWPRLFTPLLFGVEEGRVVTTSLFSSS